MTTKNRKKTFRRCPRVEFEHWLSEIEVDEVELAKFALATRNWREKSTEIE